jgi:hypothetical protein
MVVTVVAVLSRDDGVIIAVVEARGGRRLVVVNVAVIDAHETAGFVASPTPEYRGSAG